MSRLTWEQVLEAERRHGRGALPALFADLTDADRRALVPALRLAVQDLSRGWGTTDRIATLRIAGAACVGGAAGVSQWLARQNLQWDEKAAANAQVIEVLRQRRPDWIPDIVQRLAARISLDGWNADWQLVDGLARAAGLPAPPGEPYTVRWFANLCRLQYGTTPLVQRLRTDDYTRTMLPRLFEAAQVGRRLDDHERWNADARPDLSWLTAFRELTEPADGEPAFVPRDGIVDAALSALLRGAPPADARGFLRVVEALAPTEDELVSRTVMLLRLLPDAPGPVAAYAQSALRGLDEAGRLTADQVAEATRSLLFRPEKKLVRAQFTWLDKTVKRHPGRVGDLLAAATTVFTQQASDLHERALKTFGKQLPKLPEDQAIAVRAELRAVLDFLGDSARADAAALLGEEATPAAHDFPELPPFTPNPRPPAIASLDELVEEVAVTARAAQQAGWSNGGPLDPWSVELLVEALLREHARDRDALRAATDPLAERHRAAGRAFAPDEIDDVYGAVMVILDGASGRGGAQGWFRNLFGKGGGSTRKFRSAVPRPQRALMIRLAEVSARLRNPAPGPYLARPVTRAGHVDPDALVRGVEEWEALGRTPWSADLEQALLRLPRDLDPAVVVRAAGLASPAGKWVWEVMAGGGMPDPEVRPLHGTYRTELWKNGKMQEHVEEHRYASVGPTPPAFADHQLATKLCGVTQAEKPWFTAIPYGSHAGIGCWPLLAPSHRDVIAAHATVVLDSRADDQRGGCDVLPLLAAAEGPLGTGMATALALGLGARQPEDRGHAVDAFLTLAARDTSGTPAAATGAQLAELIAVDRVKTNRLAESLRGALDGGAHTAVWALMAGLLPGVLTADRKPPRLADLLAIGADAAARSGARGPLPGLEPYADAKGSSRVVVEGRRLHKLLGTA